MNMAPIKGKFVSDKRKLFSHVYLAVSYMYGFCEIFET